MSTKPQWAIVVDYSQTSVVQRGDLCSVILILYTAYLISNAICNEELENANVTTLYPVENNFITSNKSNRSDTLEDKTDIEVRNGSQKLESIEKSRENFEDVDETTTIQAGIANETTSSNNKESQTVSKVPKLDIGSWKIDTTFIPSNIDNQEDKNYSKTEQGKEFKPSPQLGHFHSEDSFVVPTKPTIEPFSAFNPSFFGSPDDFYKLNYKPPSFTSSHQVDTPYKFESTGPSRDKGWKYSSGIDAKPTEAPEKIPAGGLYKLPDPFKEKPSSDGDDDNFGLAFKDEKKDVKDNPVKKRGSPWKHLLHLVTALIPVGIILSALTPNIVTLDSVDNNPHYGNRFSRLTSDVASGELPPISESCKRRLLCELHSDSNYEKLWAGRQKLCYKIRCDDPQALDKVLQWLLQHNRFRRSKPATYE